MKNKIEKRTFNFKPENIEARADGAHILKGHAALFETLSENLGGFREKIARGAFSNAIKTDDVRALFNHNPDLVLGRNTAGTLRLAEDEIGLAIEIDVPDTQAGRDLLVSVTRGDISQMSFGFVVITEEWADLVGSNDLPVRTLKEVSLFDVSPVTYPAYKETDVAVRSFENWKNRKESAQSVNPDLRPDFLRRKLKLATI